MSTVSYTHIELRENGQLYIAGTPFKVRMIVSDHVAFGWSAVQIQEEHPQLSLGQVYAALGYYYDHQEEMDQDFEARLKRVEEMRATQGESPLIEKARAVGRELPYFMRSLTSPKTDVFLLFLAALVVGGLALDLLNHGYGRVGGAFLFIAVVNLFNAWRIFRKQRSDSQTTHS